MKIEEYTVGELPELLEKDFYKSSSHIPIYPLRARSYFHNPNAKKSDKVLWCMIANNTLVAYRLVMPDVLQTPQGEIKTCWLSCIWVNPAYRGRGFGKELTQLALEEWDHKCMATNFAPESFEMYSSMDFFYPIKNMNGLRLHFRSSGAELLAKKNRIFAAAKPILKIGDSILNALKPKQQKHALQSFGLNVQIFPIMDDEAYAFSRGFAIDEFGKRTKKTFDWLSEYCWVKQTQEQDEFAKRFHFSANAKRFEQVWHKIIVKGRLIAVMMTTIKNDDLKLPYLYVKKEHIKYVAMYIENFCLEERTSTLTIFQPDLVEYFNQHATKTIVKKAFKKRIMAFKGIPKELVHSRTNFQDGIGDGAFT